MTMFLSHRNHELLMTASVRNGMSKDTHSVRVCDELTFAKSQTATQPLTRCRIGSENRINRNEKAHRSR